MSLALKHKRKIIAQREQQAKQDKASEVGIQIVSLLSGKSLSTEPVPTELQKLEKQFNGDLETLGILKGDQQRDPLKKDLIEKYRPLCEWYMASFQDWGHLQSLAWWLVWRVDTEAFCDVEPMLYKGVQRGLTAPTKFQSDWQSWYCDQVKNYYADMLKEEKTPLPMMISKVITDIVNGDLVLHAPLKAKLFALYGKVALLGDDHKTAVKAFDKALGFDEKAGVKKLREKSVAILEEQKNEQGEDNGE
ncbi:phage terminase small subunit [Psychromonas hadalis]|uniref:phage terminase small subunit n=1 Tax=Psychromonas hadalis TaxID=211669 RepID=UPI0003B5A605|nr:phage terminase small subunit [Psychromonas hadalis]